MRRLSNTRQIASRLVVTGTLHLLTPAHFGSGDAEGLTDMPLQRDAATDLPLLPGTSIAGALRGYLLARLRGYARRELNDAQDAAVRLLFGGAKGDEYGDQSPLIVDDALGTPPAAQALEVRDGVRISARSSTAEDRKKYDLELLPAGTTFVLRFELLLPEDVDTVARLRGALAVALGGLESTSDARGSAITLGARRARGFGRCRVEGWHTTLYQLRTSAGLLAWLAADHDDWAPAQAESWDGPASALAVAAPAGDLARDTRRSIRISLTCDLAGPLLVRSADPLTDMGEQPDVSHIRSWRTGGLVPVLPGTSLAGALRARARRILNTISSDSRGWVVLLRALFGTEIEDDTRPKQRPDPIASRLIVEETVVEGGAPLVQSRVALDRFTGGAYDTALFAEAPHVGGQVRIGMTLRLDPPDEDAERQAQRERHEQAQVGLLLLLLKDLWTGDLPLGGGAGVGRGQLSGRAAEVIAGDAAWSLAAAPGGKLTIGGSPPAQLEGYVTALHSYLGGEA